MDHMNCTLIGTGIVVLSAAVLAGWIWFWISLSDILSLKYGYYNSKGCYGWCTFGITLPIWIFLVYILGREVGRAICH